ncbi:GreA/GreB family elongation factor [Patescibacteria group bacterium]|nr:GreA/GreB family elongation factor [Patescibacteria group bacterium]MBU0964067.1 GreA/GreB family elongation factor [Patescibacteria group bacterium]
MRVPIRKSGQYTHAKPDRHITKGKLQEFKEELGRLKRIHQPRAISEVKRLAEMGDFSENAAYQIAKGRLRGINERMLQLEDAVKKAIVIKPGSHTDLIQIGHHVTIVIAGEQKKYLILGSTETDPEKGIISHTSPLGKSLIGKKVGDTFTIKLANKEVECKILHIE